LNKVFGSTLDMVKLELFLTFVKNLTFFDVVRFTPDWIAIKWLLHP